MSTAMMSLTSGMVRSARWFLTAVSVCALLVGRTLGEEVKVVTRTDCFSSADTPIGVEVFARTRPASIRPSILLHAIDGLDTGYGDHYRTAARSFARKGYVVHLVHYFDRTGTRSDDVQKTKELFLSLLDQHADAAKKKITHQRSRPGWAWSATR